MMRVSSAIVASMILVANVAQGTPFSAQQRKAALAEEQLLAWEGALVAACTGHLAQGGDAAIPFISYFWRTDELKYSLAKDLIWRTMTRIEKGPAEIDAQALQSRLGSSSAAQRSALCNRSVLGLMKPASHLDRRRPKDAKSLDAIFDAHPELQLRWKRDNFTAGCVMQRFDSGGRAFRTTKSVCECETQAIFAQTSAEQREKLFGNSASKQMSDAIIQRVMPAILACQRRATRQSEK